MKRDVLIRFHIWALCAVLHRAQHRALVRKQEWVGLFYRQYVQKRPITGTFWFAVTLERVVHFAQHRALIWRQQWVGLFYTQHILKTDHTYTRHLWKRHMDCIAQKRRVYWNTFITHWSVITPEGPAHTATPTAPHCNTRRNRLQHTLHCIRLQQTVPDCNRLQHTNRGPCTLREAPSEQTPHCNRLQQTATHESRALYTSRSTECLSRDKSEQV